jgi:hypothetical protein
MRRRRCGDALVDFGSKDDAAGGEVDVQIHQLLVAVRWPPAG